MPPDKNRPPEWASRFRLKGWKGGPRQVFGKFGEVDLTTLTIAKAERLIARGFDKIEIIRTVEKSYKKSEPDPTEPPTNETGE